MDKKKLISIGIVVLTIVVVVVIAAMVGTGDNEPEVNITTTSPVQEEPIENVVVLGYSAEVLEKSLKVYKDNIFVQELKYPENSKVKFDLEFAKNHISFIDMNFDGEDDICLSVSSNEDGFGYYCWIFDSKKREFKFNEALSKLTSISLDSEKKQVITTEKNKDGATVYVIYQWKNGELKKLETKNEVSQSIKDKVIGSSSSTSTTSRPTQNNNSQSGSTGTMVPGGSNSSGSGSSGNGSGIVIVPGSVGNDGWF
jgi:hypothetical protein